ncbi:MAG: SCO family protein [Saprospiraceae bacterium]|nr:SCO family protein [Saprospiraceae bacterium]
MKNKIIAGFIMMVFMASCLQKSKPLPIIGKKEIVDGDTIYHKIPGFEFTNQDSLPVSNQSLSSYIYVADFFFISCPSICPKVKKQMLRIYDKYKGHDMVKLVSHSIDPKRDTPEKLKQYSANLGVDNEQWIFLTGNKDEIMEIADDYFVIAYEDPDAPGGFDHSGKILLIDTKGHIRSFAEGTDPEDVDRLLKDIDVLLREYEN